MFQIGIAVGGKLFDELQHVRGAQADIVQIVLLNVSDKTVELDEDIDKSIRFLWMLLVESPSFKNVVPTLLHRYFYGKK